MVLPIREALGAKSYLWTEMDSPAAFRGIQGNHIYLDVKERV